MRTRTTAARTATALAAAALLAGCTTAPDDDGAASPETPSQDASADVELPDTPAGAAAERVLAMLEPEATGPSEQEAAEVFSPAFLQILPADELAAELDRLRPGGPYPVVEVLGGDDTTVALRLASEPPVQMQVVVDSDGLVDGFPLTPDTTEQAEAATTLPELDTAMAELGNAQTYVATIADGVCTTVHSTEGAPEGGEPAPSGSVFKLAVLSALVDAIEDGEIAWEDELTLTEEVISLPTGELQDRPVGSDVAVREAAELMISISDNTATDLLIDAIGRESVEAVLTRAGVPSERATPLLTTRQLFVLGWGAPEERAVWADASPTERERLLAELPTDLDAVDVGAIAQQPVWQDGVDYVLTGGEVCAVLATLTEQAATGAGEPVLDILSINPGLRMPDGVEYLGFKGGSSTGVLASAHLLQVDGQWRVVVTQTWGEPAAISTGPVVPFLQRALDLTAAG